MLRQVDNVSCVDDIVYVLLTGVFDPLNQGAKGAAPPLEQKSEDRYRL